MTPSGYYESTEGLRGVSVVCAGVRRSATTMVFQIVRDVIGDGVIKTHQFLDVPSSVPIIVTVRDLCDCAVSWWRLTRNDMLSRNTSHMQTLLSSSKSPTEHVVDRLHSTRRKMQVEDAVRIAGVIRLDAWYMQRYIRKTVLRYEDVLMDDAKIGAAINEAIGVPIPNGIVESHCLRRNWSMKRFADKTPADSPVFGPIIDGHCHTGESGSWRRHCTGTAAECLQSLLKEANTELGYA